MKEHHMGEPDWRDVNLEEAVQASGRVTDRADLASGPAATKYSETNHPLLRMVDALSAQAELAALAMGQGGVWLRKYALGRLEDRALLYEAAASAAEAEVRIAALLKLGDFARLRQIALDAGQDFAVRRAAVGELQDGDALVRVALFDRESALRASAKKRAEQLKMKLNAPKEADEYGFVTIDGCVCGYFERGGRPVLPDTAEEIDCLWPYTGDTKAFLCSGWVPGEGRPQKAAVVPSRPVSFFQKNDIAKAALAAVTDPEDFSYILQHDPRECVRCRAVKHAAQNEELFLRLALGDAGEAVRYAAAQRLQNPASFERLLLEGKGAAQRLAAERTTNTKLLREVALASDKKYLHCIALDRAQDWTLLEIISMLGKAQREAKGMARRRMERMEEEWLASGLSLLAEHQRLYADAAINDDMFYRLVMDDMTDETCIADILCSLSPHTVGVTSYGPVGEAKFFHLSERYRESRDDIERTRRALCKLHTKEMLQKVAEHADANYLRMRARERLDRLQSR